MKNTIKICLIAMMTFSMSCSKEPINESIDSSKSFENFNRVSKSTVDVINPILDMVTGTSTLHRNKNGITVNYKTTGLIPGHAYTLWWVIWNNPEECQFPGECNEPDFLEPYVNNVAVDVLYATGHVIGEDGIGNFSAHLIAGGNYQSANEHMYLPPAGGLQLGNSFSAEVHLALRSHGPAIPGLVNDQINSYIGGCSIFFDVFTEIPDEEGECGEIEFAVHPPIN